MQKVRSSQCVVYSCGVQALLQKEGSSASTRTGFVTVGVIKIRVQTFIALLFLLLFNYIRSFQLLDEERHGRHPPINGLTGTAIGQTTDFQARTSKGHGIWKISVTYAALPAPPSYALWKLTLLHGCGYYGLVIRLRFLVLKVEASWDVVAIIRVLLL